MIAVLVILSVKISYHNASLNVEKLTEAAKKGREKRKSHSAAKRNDRLREKSARVGS